MTFGILHSALCLIDVIQNCPVCKEAIKEEICEFQKTVYRNLKVCGDFNIGKTALHTVNEVLETLDNAEGWSTWDVMGGGLMADLAKYEELDDAQEQIEQLQVELRRFKTELSDVEITADLQITVDSFLKFADFFFDGLFADWAVLNHINQAQSRVENTKDQIKRVLALLKKMREDVDVQIADEKEKQEQLAVETKL